MEPTQTGYSGRAHPPLIVGLGLVLEHAPLSDALRDGIAELAGDLDREARTGRTGQWKIAQFEPSGRSSFSRFPIGELATDEVARALDRFPAPVDSLIVSTSAIEPDGIVRLSPRAFVDRSDVTVLDAWSRASDDLATIAHARLGRLRDLALVSDGLLTGFVHVDSFHDPYYAAFATYTQHHDPAVFAPGYYWSVLLTAGHLDRLGGIGGVARRAPVWKADRLDRPEPALLLTLTPTPEEATAEDYLRLRSFLEPVLPIGVSWALDDVGQPQSVLQRPVWVFEGDPIPFGSGRRMRTLRGLPAPRPGSRPDPVLRWPDVLLGDPVDPEVLHCTMELGPNFRPDEHARFVVRVIEAWAQMGAFGEIEVLGDTIRLSEAPEIQTVEDAPVVDWAFEPRGADPEQALRVVFDGLTTLDEHFGGGVIGPAIQLEVH